jgi:hypothetical protein
MYEHLRCRKEAELEHLNHERSEEGCEERSTAVQNFLSIEDESCGTLVRVGLEEKNQTHLQL